jgi:PPOX class probable F420-dependent enzyme
MKLTESVIELIDGSNFGHIATLMRDGSPQVTPVWVDREGDLILVNTAVGRVKQMNLKRDPRVAISVIDQRDPYRRVVIRGLVVTQTHEGADEHIDRLAKKYLGVERYPYRTPQEKRIILKIRPRFVSS